MPLFWFILAVLAVLVLLPAYNRLIDQPDHWIHRPPADLIRRTTQRVRERWRIHHPPRGHVHHWQHIEICKCGLIHSIHGPRN